MGMASGSTRVALQRAGVDASTPDPADGRIERDPDGMPTGMLQEGAIDLVADHVPPASHADLVAGLLAGQRRLHALGITGWQDAIVRPDLAAAYTEVHRSGRLTARTAAGAAVGQQARPGAGR